MNRFIRGSLMLLSIILVQGCSQPPEYTSEWRKKAVDHEEMAANFKDPPSWYAPHTFWFWDSPLDRSQVRKMAEEMTRQRLNPGYVHARTGAKWGRNIELPKEQWLSEQWFDAFRAALEKAESQEMYLGYCDEYMWPSGQAAGRILENYPSLKGKSLKWKKQVFTGPRQIELPPSKFTVAGRILEGDILQTTSLQVIGEGEAFKWYVPAGNWMVYSYTEYTHSQPFEGEVNYLDPDLMNLFIPMAHYPYMEHFPERMGNSIPGVFVDNEGDFGYKLAWSEYLPVRFREMKEKELLPMLPLLTEKDNEGLYAKIRYDWFHVVSDIYSENFIGKLSDWLGERGMYYITNLWEESLMRVAAYVGDLMLCQRRVTLPGNDAIGMRGQKVHDFKETQSVCEFENKPFMSEIMGVTGWGQTPLDMKRTVDALVAWGVNHFVPHGINTNRALWSIPFPADWYTENPYWNYLYLWTDYARRAAYISRQGELVADVLLYCPLESIWALAEGYFDPDRETGEWSPEALHINTVYSDAMKVMTEANIDYLIADKHYLAMAGHKEWNYDPNRMAMEIQGRQFPVLVLPPMYMISRDNARKVLEYTRSGGYVIALGQLPVASVELGDGDPVLARYMSQINQTPGFIDLSGDKNWQKALPMVIHRLFRPQVNFTGLKHDVRISHRKLNSTHFYWVASNEPEPFSIELKLREGVGCAELWDCETGTIQCIAYERKGKDIHLRLDMEPYQAFWLVFNPARNPVVGKPGELFRPVDVNRDSLWSMIIPTDEPVKLSTVRTYISDRPVDSIVFHGQGEELNWRYQNLLGNIHMKNEWFADFFYIEDPGSERFYRYSFDLKDSPLACRISIAADDSHHLYVNGDSIAPGPNAGNYDRIDVYDLQAHLDSGKNVIAVHVRNEGGPGGFMLQGNLMTADSTRKTIRTNPGWLERETYREDWFSSRFNPAGWQSPEIPDPLIANARKHVTELPDYGILLDEKMWIMLHLPPGATSIELPGISDSIKAWVDGREVKFENEELRVPENSEITLLGMDLKAHPQKLDEAVRIHCNGVRYAPLKSWLQWDLHQYSGYVDYTTVFEIDSIPERILLDLGEVSYLVQVWLNGKEVGSRLWPPFRFEVTEHLNAGENNLKVRVGNMVQNEMTLFRDQGLMSFWGFTGEPVIKDLDAGLKGPVRFLQLIRDE